MKLLEPERSQRASLKVMYDIPHRFSTEELYSIDNILSVRKLYILQLILKRYKSVTIHLNKMAKRRINIITETETTRTKFARRQYTKLSNYMYKKINNELKIYTLNKYLLEKSLKHWLTKLKYEEIEALFEVQN